MQRNGANDVPIAPPVIPALTADDIDLSDIDLSGVPEEEEPVADNTVVESDEPLEMNEEEFVVEIPDEPTEGEPVDDVTELIKEETVVEPETAEDKEVCLDIPFEDETTPENNVSDVDYQEGHYH